MFSKADLIWKVAQWKWAQVPSILKSITSYEKISISTRLVRWLQLGELSTLSDDQIWGCSIHVRLYFCVSVTPGLVSHPTSFHRHLHSCVYVHAYTYLHLKSLNIFFKRCFSIFLTLGWTSDLLCPSECSGNDYLWIVSSFMLSWGALFLGYMRGSHFNSWNMRIHKVH